MGARYWFRPKSFGYGAMPITWEGWAVTLVSAAVTSIAIVISILAEMQNWPNRRSLQAGCFAIFAVTAVVTLAVARKKTNGDWRWRP